MGATRWAMFGGAVLLAAACGRSERRDARPVAEDGMAGEGGGAPSGGAASKAGTSHGGTMNRAGETSLGGASATDEGGNAGAPATGQGDNGGAGGAQPSEVCDDGNPCTFDTYVVDACLHLDESDGRICEDGDLCTLGDHCQAGVCVPGPVQTGAGHALGSVETYGLDLVVGAGADQFAFVDTLGRPARVTLAAVTDGVLAKRAHADIEQSVGSTFIAAAWDDLIAVADGDTTYGINGPARNLQLFSIEPDGELTPHAPVPITPGSTNNPANTSMVGRGSRLFLCHNWSFFTAPTGTLMWWDVSDPDDPVLVAQGPTGGQCGSLAASEDGERVYVNTANGVIWTDLSTWASGDITFAAEPLLGTDAGLQVRGDVLMARSAELIHVFNEADRSELGSFTVPGANGAALSDAGAVVLSDVAVGEGTENFISLYDLSGELLQKLSLSKLEYARDVSAVKVAATGAYAMDTFTRRLFAVGGDGFTELDAPQVGAMNRVFADDGAVRVRGSLAAHRVDVSEPLVPVIRAGGPTRSETLGIKLDYSLTPPSLVPESDMTSSFFSGPDAAEVVVDTFRGHATKTRIQQVAATPDEHFATDSFFDLPGGSALLRSAGDFVYRAAFVPSGAVHFQRWLVGDLAEGVTQPVMDLVFDAPAGAADTTLVTFDVDPVARIAVLSTIWSNVTPRVGTLYWIDLATQPPSVVEKTSALAAMLLVHGDRVAFSEDRFNSRLQFRQRGAAEPVGFDSGISIVRLLAFDGTTLYYASRHALHAVTYAAPAAPVASLELAMRGTPSSLTAMPGSLVAVSATQLLTLAPACQ
jgi:hypothetical protein